MTLVEQFENYKEKKNKYERDLAVYESKLRDSAEQIRANLAEFNKELIEDLLKRDVSINFNIDLSDKQQVVSLMKELSGICSELETVASELMKG